MSEPLQASHEDNVSVRSLLMAVADGRTRIFRMWAVVALLAVVAAPVYYLTRPSERMARVEFRLVFDGADRGEYPNRTQFSRADLLAAPILTQVFQANELGRYLTYEQFKSGLFVFDSSPELDMLNLEYQAKLADTRLPAPQRAAIEAEYRQKLESHRLPQMSLQFVVSSRTNSPPSDLMEKVLNDVLAQWADQTAVVRGALTYQIELLTPNVILKDPLNTHTTLIRYDLLRQHVGRVLDQVDRLTELPGSNTVRVGPDKLSLLDLRTNLEDLRQFQLNPLIRRRLIYGPANDVSLNITYLNDRLIELERFRDTPAKRKLQLERALQQFTSEVSPPIPGAGLAPDPQAGSVPTQLSNTFLDRLVDLAARSGAMAYRTDLTNRIIRAGEESLSVDEDIAFYQETLRLLRAPGAGPRPAALTPEEVTASFGPLQKRVVEILTLTNEAYATISETNLNPRSVLYRMTGPYSVRTIRPITPRYVATVVLISLIVALIVIAAAVAAETALRQFGLTRDLRR